MTEGFSLEGGKVDAPTVRFGGQPELRLLLIGGPELSDLVLSRHHGGSKLEKGLDDLVVAEHEGKYRVKTAMHPGAPVATLKRQMASIPGGHDVVILSLFPDVVSKGHLDRDALRDDARELCQALKNNGAYVLLLNTSTYDDSDLVSNYFNSVDDTPSLRAHKVGTIALDLSHELGVSIIDADRLLAEMGAKGHVESIGRYSIEASKVVCDEISRILSDYGYFEERPLVLQVGARR